MLGVAYQKGYNPYWATMRVQEKFQTEAQCPKAWARHAVFGPNPTAAQIAAYRRYLELVADKMLRSKPNRGPDFRGRLIRSCLLMEFGAIVGDEIPKARVG